MGQHINRQAVRARFAADGYVCFREYFSGEQLAELRYQMDRFVRDVLPGLPGGGGIWYDPARPATLMRMAQMYEHDAYFKDLISGSRIERLAECLLDRPVVIHNMQYFNKPAGSGSPTPPHQDGYYFQIDPIEALSFWIALEDVDEQTGCMRLVRGSHRRGMRPHVKSDAVGFSQRIDNYPLPDDVAHETALSARGGDMLAFDVLAIHRADGNRSLLRSRQALGIVYYSTRARKVGAGGASRGGA